MSDTNYPAPENQEDALVRRTIQQIARDVDADMQRMHEQAVNVKPHEMEPHSQRCKYCGIAQWHIEELGVDACMAPDEK